MLVNPFIGEARFNAPKGSLCISPATSTGIIPYFLKFFPYLAELMHSGQFGFAKKPRFARKLFEGDPIYWGFKIFIAPYMGAKAIFFRASRIPTRPPLSPGIFEKTCFKLNNDHILFIQNLNPTNHFRFTFARFTQSIIPHMNVFGVNSFYYPYLHLDHFFTGQVESGQQRFRPVRALFNTCQIAPHF